MKNSLIYSYLLIGFMGYMFASSPGPKLEIDSLYRHHTVVLKQYDWQAHEIQLKIINHANGRMVFSDQLNGLIGSTNRNILSNLSDGHYKMEMKDDLKYYAQDIFVIQKDLWISKDETPKIFEPVVKKKGKFMNISMPLTEPGFRLKMLSEDGTTESDVNFVYEDQAFRKIDLRNLRAGHYTLVLSSGDQSFFKDFKI